MGGRDQSALFVDPMGAPGRSLRVKSTKRRAEFHGAADTANCRAKRAGEPTASKIASGLLSTETD